MAIAPFVAVQWQPLDLIDQSKMQDMAQSIKYVHENTPRAKVDVGSGTAKDTNLRIAAGRITIPKKKADSHVEPVTFGNFFTSNCKPIVTTGIQSKVQQNIYCTFTGLDVQKPDHRGMRIHIEVGEEGGKAKSKDRIQRTFEVHWIAMGW